MFTADSGLVSLWTVLCAVSQIIAMMMPCTFATRMMPAGLLSKEAMWTERMGFSTDTLSRS
jgi:hypothetical protein